MPSPPLRAAARLTVQPLAALFDLLPIESPPWYNPTQLPSRACRWTPNAIGLPALPITFVRRAKWLSSLAPVSRPKVALPRFVTTTASGSDSRPSALLTGRGYSRRGPTGQVNWRSFSSPYWSQSPAHNQTRG